MLWGAKCVSAQRIEKKTCLPHKQPTSFSQTFFWQSNVEKEKRAKQLLQTKEKEFLVWSATTLVDTESLI